ncbi:hypothetical protein [uncultured Maricaulis sp.]|uniref:hypothetical protein n=1 Tax=uncultured Maricaulis sp. TaxID=174710 RepID=UPI0030D73216
MGQTQLSGQRGQINCVCPDYFREAVTISVAFGDTSSIKEEEGDSGGRKAAGAGDDGGRNGPDPAHIEEKKGGVVLQST